MITVKAKCDGCGAEADGPAHAPPWWIVWSCTVYGSHSKGHGGVVPVSGGIAQSWHACSPPCIERAASAMRADIEKMQAAHRALIERGEIIVSPWRGQ